MYKVIFIILKVLYYKKNKVYVFQYKIAVVRSALRVMIRIYNTRIAEMALVQVLYRLF